MKNKRNFIVSILQIIIGMFAIVAFAVVGLSDENPTKWIITLILAVAYVVLGDVGFIDCKSNK